MAVVKPFECIRPCTDKVCEVAALPYDVYSRKEAKEKVKGHPYSFLNIDRPETQYSDDFDMYSEKAYETAKELFQRFLSEGILQKDTEKAYYIYELIMNGRSQAGIVACASIDDYLNQVIKKHENTREEKEQDRIRHVDTCNAQTGPIFLAYRSQKKINEIVNKTMQEEKLYHFTAEDEITHNVWKISAASDVCEIEKAFSKLDEIYIADGHHRAASAVKVGLKRRKEHPDYDGSEEFNYFLSVLFPHDQLEILPYNRVVKDICGMSTEEFLQKVKVSFDIMEVSEAFQPEKKNEYGMYFNGQWYCLKAHTDILSDDPVDGLDVSILQDYLLHPILRIQDPRTDERIDFVGGIRGLKELERRVNEDMMVAFSMYPTSIEELFEVADANRLMPPKSTWFEPKLRSGIFIHSLG